MSAAQIGLSAGGHLTVLSAASGGVKDLEDNGVNPEFSSTIQASVPMGAQTALMSRRTREVSKTNDIDSSSSAGARGSVGNGSCDLVYYQLFRPSTATMD